MKLSHGSHYRNHIRRERGICGGREIAMKIYISGAITGTEEEKMLLRDAEKGYNKAIDDFSEKVKEYIAYNYGMTDSVLSEINEIAEQLKEHKAE